MRACVCVCVCECECVCVHHPSQAGHVCGDTMDIIDGLPTGSVRISFGYMSTMDDARTFVDFVMSTFVKPVSGRCRDFSRKKLREGSKLGQN